MEVEFLFWKKASISERFKHLAVKNKIIQKKSVKSER